MNLVSFSLCSDPIVEIAISIHAYTQATEACDVLAAKCGWNVDGKAEPTKDYEKSEGPGQAGINWNQHKKLWSMHWGGKVFYFKRLQGRREDGGLFASNRVQSRVIQLFPLSSGMVSNESFGRKVYFVQPL